MKRQLQPRNGKVKAAEIQESVEWLFFYPTFSQEYAIIPFGETESSEVSLVVEARKEG